MNDSTQQFDSTRILEVCVGSLEEAIAAQRAGADRLELNSALQLGGLTPSPALTRSVVAGCSIPVITMARPRPGGFCYDSGHWSTLLGDIDWALEEGVAGVAFGCLTADRKIDQSRVKEVCQRTDSQWVFHRAFDLVADWKTAISQLADMGVTRVMTSGGADSVPEGLDRIRQIVDFASGRIEVIPAGGVTPCNLTEVATTTGCHQIHGTFSSAAEDPGYANGPIRFAENDDIRATNPDKVRRAKEALLAQSNP
jgi:copper homeostasis protein